MSVLHPKKKPAKKASAKKVAAKPAPEVAAEPVGPAPFQPVTAEQRAAAVLTEAESTEVIRALTVEVAGTAERIRVDQDAYSALRDKLEADNAELAELRVKLATATDYHTSAFQSAPSW